MTDPKLFRPEDQKDEDDVSPTTIVGGQPGKRKPLKGEAYRKGNKRRQKFRVRLEQALYLAATDTEFRNRLLENRSSALDGAGIRLNKIEEMTLAAVSNETLNRMIAAVRPEDHGRRKFMQTIAASTAALAAGAAMVSCDKNDSDNFMGGAGPDIDSGLDAAADVGPDSAIDSGVDGDADGDSDADGDGDVDIDANHMDAAGGMDGSVDADADSDLDGSGVDAGIGPDLDADVDGSDADASLDAGLKQSPKPKRRGS